MNLKIVFDHADFVVVDKPSGVLTVPSRHESKDERPVLGRILEKELGRQIFPVHRLDFEVSGIVVFAKSVLAQKKINEAFEKRKVQKIYQAWTSERDFAHWPEKLNKADEEISLIADSEYLWECRILRGKRRSFESPQGDKSVTKARFKGRQKDYLQWEIEPLTGRAHQIRFELSRHGFPILGDQLYGSKYSYAQNAIALRAVSLKTGQILPDMPEEFLVEGLK